MMLLLLMLEILKVLDNHQRTTVRSFLSSQSKLISVISFSGVSHSHSKQLIGLREILGPILFQVLKTHQILLVHGITSPASKFDCFTNCLGWAYLISAYLFTATTLATCSDKDFGIFNCCNCNIYRSISYDKCELNWSKSYWKLWSDNCIYCDLSNHQGDSKDITEI